MINKLFFSFLSYIGLGLFCTLNGTASTPQTPPPSSEKEAALDQVHTDYIQGKYSDFLTKIHETYLTHSDEHNTLRKEPLTLATLVQDYHKPAKDPLYKQLDLLREKQNRELIEVCLHYPNTALSRAVKDMVFFTPTKHEQQSLEYLSSLSGKDPSEGKNALEKRLIDIDCEFWIKHMDLEIARTEKKIDAATFEDQRFVLQLEKLTRMKAEVQKKGADVQIKELVETACEVYPKARSFASTRKHLIALARGQIDPQTADQKAFQAVVKKYASQEDALLVQLPLAQK